MCSALNYVSYVARTRPALGGSLPWPRVSNRARHEHHPQRGEHSVVPQVRGHGVGEQPCFVQSRRQYDTSAGRIRILPPPAAGTRLRANTSSRSSLRTRSAAGATSARQGRSGSERALQAPVPTTGRTITALVTPTSRPRFGPPRNSLRRRYFYGPLKARWGRSGKICGFRRSRPDITG